MRRVTARQRRESRRFAIVLGLAVWCPLALAWLAWDRFDTFFARPDHIESLLLIAPPLLGLTLIWDILMERRDARREAAEKRKE
jgi:hypothetical protein